MRKSKAARRPRRSTPRPAPIPVDLQRPFVFDEDWFEKFPRHNVRVRRLHSTDLPREFHDASDHERGWMVIVYRNGRQMIRHVPEIAAQSYRDRRRFRRALMQKIRGYRESSLEWVEMEGARVRAVMDRVADPDFRY